MYHEYELGNLFSIILLDRQCLRPCVKAGYSLAMSGELKPYIWIQYFLSYLLVQPEFIKTSFLWKKWTGQRELN